MHLVDMSLSAEEKKDNSEVSVLDDKSNYPYGLTIHLEPDATKKLGIEEPPKVGSYSMMLCKVQVRSVNLENSGDDRKKCSVSYQITDLAFHDVEEKKESKKDTEVMYGKE